MPPRERAKFLALHVEADELLTAGWAAKREAWNLYRPWRVRTGQE